MHDPNDLATGGAFAGGRPTFTPDDELRALESENDARRSRAVRQLAVGALLAGVGVAITVVTYSSAEAEGGSYVVAYGPIIWGAITFFRGLGGLAG